MVAHRSTLESGTGLGLAICKQFVEMMDGCIGVTGEPGKGSLFYIEIPASISAASEEKTTEPLYEQVTGLAEDQPVHRILIAEDKLENRLLLRSLLAPLGFDLREAVNGKEAVKQFEEWPPHLIWMDIRMPVMSGLAATRHIRQDKAGARLKSLP